MPNEGFEIGVFDVSLAPRLPTPAEPERVAPASASRSGPVPPGEVHQNGAGNSAVFCWHDSAAARPQFQAQRAARFRFVCTAAAAAPTFGRIDGAFTNSPRAASRIRKVCRSERPRVLGLLANHSRHMPDSNRRGNSRRKAVRHSRKPVRHNIRNQGHTHRHWRLYHRSPRQQLVRPRDRDPNHPATLELVMGPPRQRHRWWQRSLTPMLLSSFPKPPLFPELSTDSPAIVSPDRRWRKGFCEV
jgi:hypothetical protein